eukprot:Opistho-2@63341
MGSFVCTRNKNFRGFLLVLGAFVFCYVVMWKAYFGSGIAFSERPGDLGISRGDISGFRYPGAFKEKWNMNVEHLGEVRTRSTDFTGYPAMAVLFVVGSREEAVRLAAPFLELKRQSTNMTMFPVMCAAGPASTAAADALMYFGIVPDVVVEFGRDALGKDLTSRIAPFARTAAAVELVIEKVRPDLVLVDGPGLIPFATSVAAYYTRIPIMHSGAGLERFDMAGDFPVELHKQVLTSTASFHLTRSEEDSDLLILSGVPAETVVFVGDTLGDSAAVAMSISAHDLDLPTGTPLDDDPAAVSLPLVLPPLPVATQTERLLRLLRADASSTQSILLLVMHDKPPAEVDNPVAYY